MMQVLEMPLLVAESSSYLVVYKPPGMPTAPLHPDEPNTLVAWCVSRYPEVGSVRGVKSIEGGLLHRLDTDTNGLVLFARTQKAWNALYTQQEAGQLIKYYTAWSRRDIPVTGFPPAPSFLAQPGSPPQVIRSAFRPYGPGRKAVRPVIPVSDQGQPRAHLPKARASKDVALDRGNLYETRVLAIDEDRLSLQSSDWIAPAPLFRFQIQLVRGFRHQIRCHLAWIGYPILGDWLYGQQRQESMSTDAVQEAAFPWMHRDLLWLQAHALTFTDPETGRCHVYTLTDILESS
ncbi:MAG: RNA pseudouridine synthase [Termitinemataceae bacterium]